MPQPRTNVVWLCMTMSPSSAGHLACAAGIADGEADPLGVMLVNEAGIVVMDDTSVEDAGSPFEVAVADGMEESEEAVLEQAPNWHPAPQ